MNYLDLFTKPVDVIRELAQDPEKRPFLTRFATAIISRCLALHSLPISALHSVKKGGKTLRNLSFFLLNKEGYTLSKAKRSAEKTAGFALAAFAAPLGALFPTIPVTIYDFFNLSKPKENHYVATIQKLHEALGEDADLFLQIPGAIPEEVLLGKEPIDIDEAIENATYLKKLGLKHVGEGLKKDLEGVRTGQMHLIEFENKWESVFDALPDPSPLVNAYDEREKKHFNANFTKRDLLLFNKYFKSVSVKRQPVDIKARIEQNSPIRLIELEAKLIAIGKDPKHAKTLYEMELALEEQREKVKELVEKINANTVKAIRKETIPRTDQDAIIEAMSYTVDGALEILLHDGLLAINSHSSRKRLRQFTESIEQHEVLHSLLQKRVETATTETLELKKALFEKHPGLIAFPFKQGLGDSNQILGSGVCFANSHRMMKLQIENPDMSLEELASHMRITPQDRFFQAKYSLEKKWGDSESVFIDKLPDEKASYIPIGITKDPKDLEHTLRFVMTHGTNPIGLFGLNLRFKDGGHRIILRADETRGRYFVFDPNIGLIKEYQNPAELTDALRDTLKAYYPDLEHIIWKELVEDIPVEKLTL